MRSRVIAPSSVVSSWPMARGSERRTKIASPPITAHSVLVHTPTVYCPGGWRLYWLEEVARAETEARGRGGLSAQQAVTAGATEPPQGCARCHSGLAA